MDFKSNSRRKFILDEMLNLSDKKISCSKCNGPCCTFEANSMQITVLEAVEITQFLFRENRISTDLVFHLQETIARFRLDINQGTGKTSLRKSYTCPFFEETLRKCTVSRQAKPIGCLGFNPIEVGITNGGSCKSDLMVLTKRENEFQKSEKELIEKLKCELNIYWDKAPIPIAVLEVIHSLSIEIK